MSLNSYLRGAAVAALLLSPSLADAKALKNLGGVVDGNGNVVVGSGFTAVRNGTGDYTLSFPAGSFKQFPAFTCSGAGANGGVPICGIFGLNFHTGATTTVEIRIWNTTGALQDNAFHFTEITTR